MTKLSSKRERKRERESENVRTGIERVPIEFNLPVSVFTPKHINHCAISIFFFDNSFSLHYFLSFLLSHSLTRSIYIESYILRGKQKNPLKRKEALYR
jgi:hypothetical protein